MTKPTANCSIEQEGMLEKANIKASGRRSYLCKKHIDEIDDHSQKVQPKKGMSRYDSFGASK